MKRISRSKARQSKITTSVPAVKLTAEEEEIILSALQQTWQAIGYDVLQATADGGNINRVSLPKSHVIEIVLDADYLEMYGGRLPLAKAAIEKFRKLSYDEMKRIASKTFTYARYGM